MILRRVGILADWMARSHTFSHSTGGAANRLGSLLMECVVVGLQKTGAGRGGVPTSGGALCSKDRTGGFLDLLKRI